MKKLPWILLAVTVFLLYLSLNHNGFFNFVNSEESKKKSLEITYNQIIELEKNNNYEALYQYFTPQGKSNISLSEFINLRQSAKKNYNQNYSINNIEIRNDIGVIDRTFSFCLYQDCLTTERKNIRGKKEYVYIDGKWYFNLDNNIICDRNGPYPIPSEFDRAISLIIQRMEQTNNSIVINRANYFRSIKNCLDIRYAATDSEMRGAEGLFYFSPDSPKEDLRILVSPRYQIKDDLLTAILLSHELMHAYLYASDTSKFISCIEDEAQAFRQQLLFMSTLNGEEIASLTYRYNNRTSPEAVASLDLPLTVINYSAVGPSTSDPVYNKVLNYVKNNAYYQEQCKNQ